MFQLLCDKTFIFLPCAQVYGDKDADGFYRGESGGRLGYVPCNMVSEIQVEDEETQQQLLQQGFLSTEASMEKIGMSRCQSKIYLFAYFRPNDNVFVHLNDVCLNDVFRYTERRRTFGHPLSEVLMFSS